jgi:hypothetical protein
MVYLNTLNNEYPLYIGDLNLLGIEENNIPENFFLVEDSEMPETTQNQTVVEVFPKSIDGIWKKQWEIKNLSEKDIEQLKINDIRSKLISGIVLSEEEKLVSQKWL